MSRLLFLLVIATIVQSCSVAQNSIGRPDCPPGEVRLDVPPSQSGTGNPGLPVIRPPQDVVLWPAGARIQQMFELQGNDLAQVVRNHQELQKVHSIIIADYVIPGPPALPSSILEFYTLTLYPPEWTPFFQSTKISTESASIAFKGKNGFISVLARPTGATVTYIKGQIELSAVPLLERVVREAIASKGREPVEARERVDAALQLRAEGKVQDAIKCLQGVIRDYPNSPTAHINLAMIYREQRNYEAAGEHFRRAIGIAPFNAGFRGEYALMLMERGDLERAQYELEQAVTMDPWSTSLQTSLGKVFEARGKFREAEIHYRRVVEMTGNSPEALVDLGRALEKQGKRKEALQSYREALKINKNFSPAQEGISRLEQ